ncbi:hypothetical protein AB1Y20_010461 [Prymnesium parvum]|uniref:Uncharacterized protein n=1 Tax=Prymnesium parvum TaxID=97485 RepID=A0AB34INR1_PRYPA
MAAKRPWWHEIVDGLSTEKTPAARPSAAVPRSDGFGDLADPRFFGTGSRTSHMVRSPASRKKVLEWDPGSPAVEWVRRATFDGRAIAIRRAQDARGRHAQTLGITPLIGRLGPPARALAPPPRPQSAPLLRWGSEPFRNELPLAPARRAETRLPAPLAGTVLPGNPFPLALEGTATAARREAPSSLCDRAVVADAHATPPFTATLPPPPPAAPCGSPTEEHPPSIPPQRVGSQGVGFPSEPPPPLSRAEEKGRSTHACAPASLMYWQCELGIYGPVRLRTPRGLPATPPVGSLRVNTRHRMG